MLIQHIINIEVASPQEAEEVKNALINYTFLGKGFIDTHKKLEKKDGITIMATKTILKKR
jgi:hypothetical protein